MSKTALLIIVAIGVILLVLFLTMGRGIMEGMSGMGGMMCPM